MTAQRRIAGFETELACLTSPSIDDTTRPLAVCVHGFPDSAHTWRHLMPSLENAGWRVAAPFLRGYAPSDVPDDGCVQLGASVHDLAAVHQTFDGDERAAAIGHDWGGVIVYGAAVHAPERWSKVVGLAVPPGPALGTALLTDTDQLKRSWYMFFFQTMLADIVVPADDLAFIDMIWSDWSPGYDAAIDLEHTKNALRDPANLAAAIGYYRATIGGVGVRDDLADTQAATQEMPPQPLLYLHGANDGCVGVDVAGAARATMLDSQRFEVVDDAGHFLHLERPDTVNQMITEFLS